MTAGEIDRSKFTSNQISPHAGLVLAVTDEGKRVFKPITCALIWLFYHDRLAVSKPFIPTETFRTIPASVYTVIHQHEQQCSRLLKRLVLEAWLSEPKVFDAQYRINRVHCCPFRDDEDFSNKAPNN